jgi:hypothetical protein
MIRRRQLIVGIGSAAAWPMVARAQQPGTHVVEHQRAMAEMAAGRRGFDALVLGEEPIERVVEFLLVDLAERQHGAEPRGRGGGLE